MDGQQIRLRWTSHQGTVLSVFDALLSSESLVDVTLACEGQYVRAHKVMLSACSPYFQDLINVDVNKHPIFFLKDVKYTELRALIQYMYRGEVNIPREELPSLLAVAQALKIRGLADVETGNNSIASDTIILPDQVKTRNHKPPPPPPPVIPAPPPPQPPALIPTMPSTSNVTRNSFQSQDHSFVPQHINSNAQSHHNASVSTSGLSGPPAHKKSRIETRHTVQNAQVQIKQSQIGDPIRDVPSPSSVKPHFLDALHTALPSTSSHHESPGHSHSGHSQDIDYGHGGGKPEDPPEPDLYGSETVKVEATPAIEIDLEDEEENSMSQSSFSESWQLGYGDNSGVADDDGEMAGGSGGGEGGGAEGGEGGIVCSACGKFVTPKGRKMHFHYDCPKFPAKFSCNLCPFKARRNERLKIHLRRVHSAVPVRRRF